MVPQEFDNDAWANLNKQVQTLVREKVKAIGDLPLTDVEFPIALTRDKDGAWTAPITDNPTEPDQDRPLIIQGIIHSNHWFEYAVHANVPQWLAEIFPNAGSEFFSAVEVRDSTPADSGSFDELKVNFAYPNPAQTYEAAAKAAYDEYNALKDPIFGEITQSDFESKMSSKQSDLVADQPGTAVIKITSFNPEDLPAADADFTNTDLDSVTEATVISKEVNLTQNPADAKKDAITPKLEQLNKEKVVKTQKLPKTKILQGKSSGTLVKLVSKGKPDQVITLKKGSKIKIRVMLRAGKNLNIRVPAGKYTLTLSSGSTWYGTKYTYGPTGWYSKSSMTVKGGNYYHTLTFNTNGGNTTLTPTGFDY